MEQAWKGLKRAHIDSVRAVMRGSPFLNDFIGLLPAAEADGLIAFKVGRSARAARAVGARRIRNYVGG
jgi:hypothetical protein